MLDWLTTWTDLEDVERISHVGWQLQNTWPAFVTALLVVGVIAFGVWSYRWERGRRRTGLLTTLRVISLALLLVLLLQPILTIEYTTRGESKVITIVDRSQSMTIGDERYEANTQQAIDELLSQQSGDATRWDIARAALADADRGVLAQIEAEHGLELFSVADDHGVVDRDEALAANAAAQGKATALGPALEDIARRFGGENIAGIVLLSDMAWNAGSDPVATSKRFGDTGTPIFPIPIGLADPPDAAVTSLHVRDRVFAGETIPLKIQVHASKQLVGQVTELIVCLGDVEAGRRTITLEQGTQLIELPITSRQLTGTATLEAELVPLESEVTDTNNRQQRQLSFIDEKIKVLYVEGMPRWEYRYLQWVLRRDPRLDVKFLMTQGDPELARFSPVHISSFPGKGSAGFDFDLVIIGDVPSSYFSSEQMAWMEEQVQRRGGSLLMLGGSLYAPQTYVGTPVGNLLPVKVLGARWTSIPDQVVPVPTEAGFEGRIATLGVAPQHAVNLWAQLAPLYDVAPVAAKPGSTVLVSLAGQHVDGMPYPLVSWHRYGQGKVMFVGTELLWRLRKRTGREHHEAFWSTAIQFMTLSRLMGGNDRVTVEADRAQYKTGESVRLFADVLDPFLEPVTAPSYTVEVRRVAGPNDEVTGEAESETVMAPSQTPLTSTPGAEGFYRGFFVPQQPGTYEVLASAADREVANIARFEVTDVAAEMVNPAMRQDVADQLAAVSGGRVVSLTELDQLAQLIDERQPRFVREATVRLWDHPLLYLLLLAVAGSEWWLRRRERLV